MKMKVLIIGAGSIGNHLSQAARAKDWEVTVCDTDSEALRRMREDIYPARYGAWDSNIIQEKSDGMNLPTGDYDLIMVGTPPESHLSLAKLAIELCPRILHIEKPLGTPLDDFAAFTKVCKEHPEVMVTVGYDHAVAESVSHVLSLIQGGVLGSVIAIDSFTNEHWAGIFKAHPWLEGPHDSYLGYWRRGGGALCEHSHALHLGLVIAEVSGWDPVCLSSGITDIVKGGKGEDYDRASHLLISPTSNIGVLRVAQDVITKPTIKGFRVIGTKGRIDVSLSPALDTVVCYNQAGEANAKEFSKSRLGDFLALMNHYEKLLNGEISYSKSPIRLEKGVEVMKLISQSFSV
jgi:predicted dehydrogenase